MHIYIHIYICIHTHTHICAYIYMVIIFFLMFDIYLNPVNKMWLLKCVSSLSLQWFVVRFYQSCFTFFIRMCSSAVCLHDGGYNRWLVLLSCYYFQWLLDLLSHDSHGSHVTWLISACIFCIQSTTLLCFEITCMNRQNEWSRNCTEICLWAQSYLFYILNHLQMSFLAFQSVMCCIQSHGQH